MPEYHELLTQTLGEESPEENIRLEAAIKLSDYLERIGFENVFSTANGRREFLLELDNHIFMRWLERINGLSRNIYSRSQELYGSGGTPSLLDPPRENKRWLLLQSLESSQRILSRGGDVEQQLEDVALLLGGAINYIHPFIDGNGRTSRIINFMLREDSTADCYRQMTQRLASCDGRKILYNNPETLTSFLNDGAHRKLLQFYEVENLPLIEPDLLIGEPVPDQALGHLSAEARSQARILSGYYDEFGAVACSLIMLKCKLLPEQVDLNEGVGNSVLIDPKNYFSKFNNEHIALAYGLQMQMLIERLLLFIHAIETPEQHPIVLNTRDKPSSIEIGATMTLKDYYQENINHNSQTCRAS